MSNVMTMYKIAGWKERILSPIATFFGRLRYGKTFTPPPEARSLVEEFEKLHPTINEYKSLLSDRFYELPRYQQFKHPEYATLRKKHDELENYSHELIDKWKKAKTEAERKRLLKMHTAAFDEQGKIIKKMKEIESQYPRESEFLIPKELEYSPEDPEMAVKLLGEDQANEYLQAKKRYNELVQYLNQFQPTRVPLTEGFKSVLQDPEARKGLYMVGGAGATAIGAPIGGYMYYKKKKEEQKPINRIKRMFGR